MKKLIIASVAYVTVWAVVFYVMMIQDVTGDYVTSITAAAVGYLAYLVYSLGQINQLVSSAKILVLDVRNAEDAIQGVRGGANHSTWSNLIMFLFQIGSGRLSICRFGQGRV